VFTGEVLESFTSHQRTIQTWYSYVKVRVDLWDIATGKVVWSRTYAKKRSFLSTFDAMRDIAERVVRELDKEFYRTRNKPL
jgi:TolB-like protein